MSIIYKILSIFKSEKADFQVLTPEINELMEFRKELLSFQEVDRYIARSDYAFLHEKYSRIYTFFDNGKNTNTISFLEPDSINNPLGIYLSKLGLTQVRIAEESKFNYITT